MSEQDLRAELHRLVDGLDAAQLPAALVHLTDAAERPVSSMEEGLAALAALPGGLPPADVARAQARLAATERRAS
jgi:hypothetical protein